MGTAAISETHEKRHKLTKLTKSEKKRGASLREELQWLVSAEDLWPFSIPIEGEKRRQTYMLVIRLELDQLYGERRRDE